MSPHSAPDDLAQQLGEQLHALQEIVDQALANRLEQEQAAKRAYALLKPSLPDPADATDPELQQLLRTLQLCRGIAYRWRSHRLNGYWTISEIARRLQEPPG